MNQPFQYSILKYRPSYLLDERVNIGLLFHFTNMVAKEGVVKNDSKFIFVFPTRLRRISNFFPNLGRGNLTDIRRYLIAFQNKANALSLKEEANDKSLKEIIPSEFIVNDANSFFFSEIKQGFYKDIKQTLDYYRSQYFKFYDKTETKKSHDYLVKEYFKNTLGALTTSSDERLTYFEEGVSIENKITTSKFEYRWQNGTANLIKTLGFDLSDKQDIQDKAFKWSAAINYVSEVEQYKDYRFDILVAQPTNRTLFDAYDKALEVLSDIKATKKIIEKEKIKDYAEDALASVKPLEG